MIVVLLGPPGVGKGTHAKWMVETYGWAHLSTGDMLRAEIAEGTELGLEVKSFVSTGGLVPDGTILKMVKGRLARPECAKGVILDGFPRTTPQAEGLDQLLADVNRPLDRIVALTADPNLLVKRLTNRRSCSQCGKDYNLLFSPPKSEGVCDLDGAALIQREDDREETIRHRFGQYQEKTGPLLDYYRNRPGYCEVDATRDLAAIRTDLRVRLG